MAQMVFRLVLAFVKYPLIALRFALHIIMRQVLGGRVIVKRGDVYYIPMWVPLAVALVLFTVSIRAEIADVAHRVYDRISLTVMQITNRPTGEIATLFAPSVQHWSSKISEWADLYDVDTQLLATVMQIESCGHPTVVSSAGARGLFQVMPFHFQSTENMVDPDTNARRGGQFLNYCYNAAGGDIGLTLGCYNGGPSVINRPLNTWANETQRYYRWGVGIYSDAIMNRPQSETLNQWMNAGGASLCTSALNELRTYSSSVAVASS